MLIANFRKFQLIVENSICLRPLLIAGPHALVALTNEAYAAPKELGKSQIVFNRYGDSYFLSEMHWEQYPTARTLPMGSNEVAIAKTITKQGQIAVAARH